MKTNNAKFLRNLVISYSILLIVVLMMGVYLYTISIKNVSKEIRNQNLFMLDKTIHDMDSAFKNMDVLSGQIVNNSRIAQLSNIREIKDNAFYLKLIMLKMIWPFMLRLNPFYRFIPIISICLKPTTSYLQANFKIPDCTTAGQENTISKCLINGKI